MTTAADTGRIIRYLLLGLGVFIFAWVFLVAGPLEELDRLEKKEQSLTEEFEGTIALEQNKEALQAQMEWLRNELTSMKEVLPDSFRVALSEWVWPEDAWYYGVKIHSLKFGPESRAEFFAHRPFSMKARGNFRSIHNFLYDRFYASGVALKLTDFELQSKGTGEPLTFVLTGVQYRYLSGGEQ
jgi:Tfp pilus assembly protein PilO